jgi:hypothetical protein
MYSFKCYARETFEESIILRHRTGNNRIFKFKGDILMKDVVGGKVRKVLWA